jgi:pimeloyl-ACP methyl ester carboxylesterase
MTSVESCELRVDVSTVLGISESLETAVTVALPDPEHLGARPVVCFAFPGGGYSRRYFTFDLPGSEVGGQAGWHARRGWLFVSVDHLGVGESAIPGDLETLTYEVLARANHETVKAVLHRLAEGTLQDGFPPVQSSLHLGIGQSMGGCLGIVQQGQFATFDGLGVLGYSARHTVLPQPPGTPHADRPFYPARGFRFSEASLESFPDDSHQPGPNAWAFHYDDEAADLVQADMSGYPLRAEPVPSWASATIPPSAVTMLSPGVVSAEAAMIRVPVFVGVGERDVCPEPRSEPSCYLAAPEVDLFICPRMAHMHNFASTRERLWERIHHWGEGLASRDQHEQSD